MRWVYPGYVYYTLGNSSWICTRYAGHILDSYPMRWEYPRYIHYTLGLSRIYTLYIVYILNIYSNELCASWAHALYVGYDLGFSALGVLGFSRVWWEGGEGGGGGGGATKRAPN